MAAVRHKATRAQIELHAVTKKNDLGQTVGRNVVEKGVAIPGRREVSGTETTMRLAHG